jgi:hypothetical protein
MGNKCGGEMRAPLPPSPPHPTQANVSTPPMNLLRPFLSHRVHAAAGQVHQSFPYVPAAERFVAAVVLGKGFLEQRGPLLVAVFGPRPARHRQPVALVVCLVVGAVVGRWRRARQPGVADDFGPAAVFVEPRGVDAEVLEVFGGGPKVLVWGKDYKRISSQKKSVYLQLVRSPRGRSIRRAYVWERGGGSF